MFYIEWEIVATGHMDIDSLGCNLQSMFASVMYLRERIILKLCFSLKRA